MNNKYIWNENDIKFVDKDQQKQDVEYSSATSFGCPFEECSCNTSCNGNVCPRKKKRRMIWLAKYTMKSSHQQIANVPRNYW